MPRTVFPSSVADHDAPALGFPADSVARARIPDERTVWVFSDIHGLRSGLEAALLEAGLIDGDVRWSAPPGTTLVGLGDYIDRGRDSVGVVILLLRLAGEAASAGSDVVLVRGNHEQMLLDVVRGDDAWLTDWMSKGGTEFLRSLGQDDPDPTVESVRTGIEACDPALIEGIANTLPYAIWRDVLLVHAAPPPGVSSLDELVSLDAQMWHATAFLASDGLADAAFDAYRAVGIRRIAMGHVPQTDGPTVTHDGTVLLLDTNASARSEAQGRRAYATLARLPVGSTFEAARFVSIDTSDADDRAPRRKGA